MISEKRVDLDSKVVAAADYLAPVGDAMAQSALVLVPGLVRFENRRRGRSRYGLAVATEDGLMFRVGVEAFSSRLAGLEQVDSIPELRWPLPADAVRQARASLSPVILFLIDADTQHGRFARLDTLPPPRGSRPVLVAFPRASLLETANLERLIAELRARYQRPADSTAA